MAGKLTGSSAISTGTITSTQLTSSLSTTITEGAGPKIKTINYPGANTSARASGNQTIYLVGSGFYSNSTVVLNGNAAPSVSYISASNIGFTTPALSVGTYPVYVVNTDGGFAIKVPGLSVTSY